MVAKHHFLATLLIAPANYYITTFTIWFGHWFSHLRKGPLTGFHSGHHILYPNSQNIQSQVFRSGHDRRNSNFALAPWLMLTSIVQYFFLPTWIFVVSLTQTTLLAIIVGYVHINFHLLHSKLDRFQWFLRARRLHEVHHDRNMNYMVVDHFWDRLAGTYAEE